MRIAADAADRVTADTQLLARPVVTARARRRIATRFAAVRIVGAREADPARRMRTAPVLAHDAARCVTRDAAIRRMARRTCPGLGPRFERVARQEVRAVHARPERIREVRRRRQRRDGLAVTLEIGRAHV